MASARELLDQADALMRRNRGGSVEAAAEIPLLTDVVEDRDDADDSDFPVLMDAVDGDDPDFHATLQADASPWLAERQDVSQHGEPTGDQQDVSPQYGEMARDDPDGESHPQHGRVPGSEWPSSAMVEDGLTLRSPLAASSAGDDAVTLRTTSAVPASGEEARAEFSGDAVLWLGPDMVDPSLFSATGSMVSPTSMSLRAAGSQSTPPPRGSEGRWVHDVPPVDGDTRPVADTAHDPAEDFIVHPLEAVEFSAPQEAVGVTPPEDPALDDELHWRAVSEQISMQVLQRIDLFTDSGLKVQLAAHLKPIVDRAGAELVASINDQVGRLLRTYVAEAIEREIAQWRDDNR